MDIDNLSIKIKTESNRAVQSIETLTNRLNRLSTSLNSINGNGISRLGTSIYDLTRSLRGLDSVSNSVKTFTNTIARLGASGDKVGKAATGLAHLGIELNRLASTMSNLPAVSQNTMQFTKAIAQLASAGERTNKTAQNLQKLAVSLSQFMATMSKAPKVSQNTLQMTQALAQLTNNGGKVGTMSYRTSNGLNTFSTSSSRAAKSSKSLAYHIGKLYANFWVLFRVFRGIGSMISYASQLTEVQNVVDTTFGDMNYKVEEFSQNSIKQFGMSELSVKQYASRFQAMGTAMGISAEKIGKANSYLNGVTARTTADGVTESYVGLSNSLSDVSINLTKLTSDLASFYDMEQSDVAKDLESIFTGSTRPLRTYGLDITEATMKEWAMKEGLDADIKSMTQAEKAMLRYQYVMAHTTAAQGDFAKTADTWANSIRILKQQLQQIGGTLGTAFINMLKPLVHALNSALVAVNEFVEKAVNSLGVIFGWKIEMQNVGISGIADDTEDYASALGDAAGNAKKLKQQLQGFDELNVLNSDNNSGGSGGGGSTGGGSGSSNPLYKFTEEEGLFNSDINTLNKLGKFMGESLTNTLKSIDWDEVYQGAKDFGTGLASFLNGLISPDLFGALGTTIAGSLNTALYALNSFGTTFEWKGFGESIGTGINKFFETYDFKATAEAINTWAKGILDLLTSAVDEIEWDTLGRSIGDFINGIDFAEIGVKFLSLASKIIVGIGEALLNILDTSPIEGAIITVIGGLKLLNAGKSWANTIGQTIMNELGVSISNNGTNGGTNTGSVSTNTSSNSTVKTMSVGKLLLGATIGLTIGDVLSEYVVDPAIANEAERTGNTETAEYYREYGGFFKSMLGLLERQPTAKELGKAVESAGEEFGYYLRHDVFGIGNSPTTTYTSSFGIVHGGGSAGYDLSFKGIINAVKVDTSNLTDNDKTVRNSIMQATKVNDSINNKTLRNFVAEISRKTDMLGANKTLTNFMAELSSKNDKISDKRLMNFVAEMVSAKDNISVNNKVLSASALFQSGIDRIPTSEKVFSSKANFNTYSNGIGTPSLDSKAYLTTYTNAMGNIVLSATAKLDKAETTSSFKTMLQNIVLSVTKRATGGVFSGGTWHPIEQFANGGFPGGQMFIAREAGPELVGTLGGHTAVMNNDQIVASVAAGVANAVASVMSNINNNNNQSLVVNLDGKEIFNSTRKYATDYYRQTGKNALVY